MVDIKLIYTFRIILCDWFTKYDIEFPSIELRESKDYLYQETSRVIFISCFFKVLVSFTKICPGINLIFINSMRLNLLVILEKQLEIKVKKFYFVFTESVSLIIIFM